MLLYSHLSFLYYVFFTQQNIELTGDYKTFHDKTVLPLSKTFHANKFLVQHESKLFSVVDRSEAMQADDVDVAQNDSRVNANISSTGNRKNVKLQKKIMEQQERNALHDLSKFNQSLEISTHGLHTLRTLHKQVRSVSYIHDRLI
jgi:hypothetical protein